MMQSINILNDLLSRVTDVGRMIQLTAGYKTPPSLIQKCVELLKKDGEATGLALADDIFRHYQSLEETEKLTFFEDVVQTFGVDETALNRAIIEWQKDPTTKTARALHFASEPRSQSLCRRLNQKTNGTFDLVQMRADLLRFIKARPDLKALDKDFEHLFSSWFNRGFIQLERINWNTPAAILEKIIAYEAVHQINGWDDLRQRVASPDRRLYGYFHPALGDEPLIFVEVALTKHVPSTIHSILDQDRPPVPKNEATTAVFYSISNCQTGLKGISFGNFLIKHVVETLRQEFENLTTFITLSPVPGFRKWALSEIKSSENTLDSQDLAIIESLQDAEQNQAVIEVATDNAGLRRLLVKYLVNTRSNRGGATDPVARFHLGNGARLENVHLVADTTPNGLANSWGCMVNYQYHVKDIEANHEAYINQDKIAAAPAVLSTL